MDGVNFKCTGCGKCCQIEGEVLLTTEEFTDLVMNLNMPTKVAIDLYVEKEISGWVTLKSKLGKDKINQCIFLDNEGRYCTIYGQRPLQCQTYPYWTPLLMNVNKWKDERVVPPEETGKHWSVSQGGCEGIEHKDATVVATDTIYLNSKLYEMYSDRFPTSFLSNHSNTTDFINAVKAMKVTSYLIVLHSLIFMICRCIECDHSHTIVDHILCSTIQSLSLCQRSL